VLMAADGPGVSSLFSTAPVDDPGADVDVVVEEMFAFSEADTTLFTAGEGEDNLALLKCSGYSGNSI
jgi:hypothetical protein